MKIEKHHKIGFFDIDHQFKLRIQSVARFFQEIAVSHSTSIGAGPDVLFEKGVVWFLHRLEIEFFRYPMLYEDIKVTTWSRGLKDIKASGSIIYTHPRARLPGDQVSGFLIPGESGYQKVPAQISELYEFEKEKYFDKEIDDWETCGKIEPEKEIDISLRYSDFDVNGHVNNTIYLGFLETLYHKTINSNGNPIKNIKIRFSREIDKGKENIRTGWQKTNGVYHCNIFDDSTVYADAQITPMD